MTGYSKQFAVGRKPSFLQGEKTSIESKTKIRNRIYRNEPFRETVMNYKKNQAEYLCEIEFFPIVNKQKETKAFLALETELK